jgi:hypothetical protein
MHALRIDHVEGVEERPTKSVPYRHHLPGWQKVPLLSPKKTIQELLMLFSMDRKESARRARSVIKKTGFAAKTKLIRAAVDMYEYATRPSTSDQELERAARIIHILHHAAGIMFDDAERTYRAWYC